MATTPSLLELYHSLLNDVTENSKHLPLLSFLSSKISRKPGEIFLLSLSLITILTALGFLGHYFTIFVGCFLALSRTLQVLCNQCRLSDRVRSARSING